MTDTIVNTTILLPDCRILWPVLFSPAPPAANPTGDPKYSCVLVWSDPNKAQELLLAIRAVLIARFNEKVAMAVIKAADRGMPLKKCENSTNATLQGLEGFYCNASATLKVPPKVYDQQLDPVIDPELIYGGCYVNAQVNAYAWEFAKTQGASVGLKMLQLIGDGDPLGNAAQRPGDVFKPIDKPPGDKPKNGKGKKGKSTDEDDGPPMSVDDLM